MRSGAIKGTAHVDGYAPTDVHLHMQMVAFMGTAQHLIEKHAVDPDDLDVDDPHALAHDHAVLHGAAVTEGGNLRAVP